MAEFNKDVYIDISVEDFFEEMDDKEKKEMAKLLGFSQNIVEVTYRIFVQNEPLKVVLHDILSQGSHYNHQRLEEILRQLNK